MLHLKRGINIGDHFEDESVHDAVFKNPMQDWYYPLIRQLNFDHIRLPVRWSVHCDDANGHRIDSDYMDMVAETVDKFLDMGLSVILNVHHFRECAEFPDKPENTEKLYALWDQIAHRFRDYPEQLVFELMNEPIWNVQAPVWNRVQTGLVNRLRQIQPDRWLMIGGVNYNGVERLADLEVPANDPHLIGTFHYYLPMEFTHQGAPWTTQYVGLHDIRWTGTPDEMRFMNANLDLAKAWSDKYGLPVHLGEFGVLHTAQMEDRANWTRAVRTGCESRGISWSYWELNRNFGISEPDRPALRQPLVDALLKD